MPDDNLNATLHEAAMYVRGFLDERNFSNISFKITALCDGKVIYKVGVVGKDDPASK